jgi:hypothetical protein
MARATMKPIKIPKPNSNAFEIVFIVLIISLKNIEYSLGFFINYNYDLERKDKRQII